MVEKALLFWLFFYIMKKQKKKIRRYKWIHLNIELIKYTKTYELPFSIDELKIEIQDLKEGQTVEGIVKNITKFGAFVELDGGKVGLVRLEDLAVARTKNPSERIKIGQNVNIVVKIGVGYAKKYLFQQKSIMEIEIVNVLTKWWIMMKELYFILKYLKIITLIIQKVKYILFYLHQTFRNLSLFPRDHLPQLFFFFLTFIILYNYW